jgi:hypothetical protein
MKYLLSLALMMSFVVNAQEDEASYKYEPQVNKAEYYIGKFNKGKDVDDLAEWYGKFAKWAEGKDGVYDKMTVAILQPTPTEQYKALETWVTGGGAKLLESLPVTNSIQVDTVQWAISEPASMKPGNIMFATYSDCSLEEGYNQRQVYDLYKDFAVYAKSVGDTLGRKMIVPLSGYQLPEGVDFIRLMYTSSISEAGTNADLFWDKIAESEANANLKGFSCTNAESYFGSAMRTAQ